MALVIINIHLNLVEYVDIPWMSITWNYINDMAVPTFFILSSFFLFRKVRESDMADKLHSLRHYECRLVKLYLFWVVALFPIILYCWHPEYLTSSYFAVFLFIKNFFFSYEFGASWFFGALLVGVPIIFLLRNISNGMIALLLTLLVYIYLYADFNNKVLYQIYTDYTDLLRDPKLSFPAGMFWISIGAAISNRKILKFVEECRLRIFISGGGGIFILLGILINDLNYLFRIPAVIFLICCFGKIEISNQVLCKKLRIYSTHFFCLHYSLIIVMQHFPEIYFDNKVILGVEVLLLCFFISNIIISLSKFKQWAWLKYSM